MMRLIDNLLSLSLPISQTKMVNAMSKKYQHKPSNPTNRNKFVLLLLSSTWCLTSLPHTAIAQTSTPGIRVIVNSNSDGVIKPDNKITLREAIALVNGTLSLDQLSSAERVQVSQSSTPKIEFDLPPEQTQIGLKDVLPPLVSNGLIVDGTTQPGYDQNKSATAEIEIPIPVVEITPAANYQVFRGLTVAGNNITIRGLSLYGFTAKHRVTETTPPADIFIAPLKSTQEYGRGRKKKDKNNQVPLSPLLPLSPSSSLPPQNTVIENNWLGISSTESTPATRSAFGVSVFNGTSSLIRRNRIQNHDGSAVITGKQAERTVIEENILLGNGVAGMPDTIRLDGNVKGSQIRANLMCGNDGSGIFLFKTEGNVSITENQIKYNGRRLRRAGIYLMGNDHIVKNNQISNQTGAGVVVTSYPPSRRNVIEDNIFNSLEGLSVDLNTTHNVKVKDFQIGDGVNPQRNSKNRRLDTGNAAINTPQFLASQFLFFDNKVNIDGKAEPGSTVQIYQVYPQGQNSTSSLKAISQYQAYPPLKQPLTKVKADENGRFGITLTDLKPGDAISAIATHPEYGTSEPAAYSTIVTKLGEKINFPQLPAETPKCITRPKPPTPEPVPQPIPEPTPIPEPPQTIRLKVPRNIHFALDKDFISEPSADILDQVVDVLQQYPNIVIELQGHTDSRASNAYNQDLAKRRATNARNYLINKGIAPERMTIRSFGERQLRTEENSKVNFARNRRVEIMFFDVRGLDIEFENQETDLQVE